MIKTYYIGIFLVFFFPIQVFSIPKGELTIVSTSPSVVNNIFIDVFEKKYPNIVVKLLTTKTPSAVKYITEHTEDKKSVDLFWSSSVTAFQILKENKFLIKYSNDDTYISNKFLDEEHYYTAVALSGYGFMYNARYLQTHSLPIAHNRQDLSNPIYKDHIGMATPSQSGTTHIIVEGLLQGQGWDNGWKIWKDIAANIKNFTKRSIDVPDAVSKGQFGLGLVIDYYGLSYREIGFPVNFSYLSSIPLVPNSIALIKNSTNQEAAKLFINFLLSPEGQRLSFSKEVSRLPIDPKIYSHAPKDYLNPFTNENISSNKFDIKLSTSRDAMVDKLFDALITDNIIGLKKAASAILEAESALQGKSNKKAEKLIKEAKDYFYKIPITYQQAMDQDINNILSDNSTHMISFKQKTQNKEQYIRSWKEFSKENYLISKDLARKASKILATTDYNLDNTSKKYGAFIIPSM